MPIEELEYRLAPFANVAKTGQIKSKKFQKVKKLKESLSVNNCKNQE